MSHDRIRRLARRPVGRELGGIPPVARYRAARVRDGQRHYDHAHRKCCLTVIRATGMSNARIPTRRL